MIDIHQKPVHEYLQMLSTKTRFSFSRVWDGEMACIVGREGKNCDSCDYMPTLRDALRQTLINNKPYLHGLYFPMYHNGTKNLRRSFEEYLLSIKCRVRWVDSTVFQRSFESGGFYTIIRALNTRDTVLVGGARLKPIQGVLKGMHFIEIPEINAFNEIDSIETRVRQAVTDRPECVVMFSAGMASNVLIDRLYGEPATMIDMGSVWDACLNLNTRQWMKKIPDHVVRRNVYGV